MWSNTPGTTLAEMKHQIEAKTSHESLELGDDSRNLLRAAVAEYALDADVRNRILVVARTIANLDRSERIEARHLCEAINYRTFVRSKPVSAHFPAVRIVKAVLFLEMVRLSAATTRRRNGRS